MTTVVIHGEEIRSERDLHRLLARALDFGPYYGNNLNALWDRLTTDVPRPVELVWLDAAHSREHLGEDLFNKITGVLLRVQKREAEEFGRPDDFVVQIQE